PMNKLFALNAATGEKLWMYDPQVPASWVPYTAACRSVAFYSNPNATAGQACAERIIEGTLDMRLIAVDAKSGQPCQDFGKNGSADLKVGLAQKDSDTGAVTPVIPGTAAITAAPVIVRGVVSLRASGARWSTPLGGIGRHSRLRRSQSTSRRSPRRSLPTR